MVKFYSGKKVKSSGIPLFGSCWHGEAGDRLTRSRAAYVDLIWDHILFTPISSKLEVYPKYTETGSY